NCSYLLTQLQTSYSWLATHSKLHKLQEDDKCECGAIEIVIHVLIDCPKLRVPRQELRRKIGTAFNDISNMLGGRFQGKKGKENDMQGGSIIGITEISKPRVIGPLNTTPGTKAITGRDEALNSS
ncbi:hypothetical protein TSTA_061990, partial [Talaromyces stipitatus ATCC 10500]